MNSGRGQGVRGLRSLTSGAGRREGALRVTRKAMQAAGRGRSVAGPRVAGIGLGLGRSKREANLGRRATCLASRRGEDDGGASTSQPADEPLAAFALLSAVSGVGALETAYLTFTKVFAGSVFCPTSGCETILESRYSEILGVPVALFGFFTYSGVSLLSRLAARNGEYRAGVLAGSTVLASVSAFLAYVLATQFPDETCAWCLASCGLSFSSFVLALWATSDGDPVKSTIPPFVASPLIVSALVALFADADGSLASEDFELPFREPEVTTQSSREALNLVQKMRLIDAKMYGAFWCSHCFDQKQAFGKEAMKNFPYVECFPEGYRKGIKQYAACEEADIRGFPTWIINGEKIEGDQSLETLGETVDKYLAGKDQDYSFE